MSGADEVMRLSAELGKASKQVVSTMFDTFRDEGDQTAEDWANIVRAGTRQKYSKHYDDAITAEAKPGLNIVVEVGPESGAKQGRMGPGFERRIPGIEWGLQAVTNAEPRIEKAADSAVERIVP